MQTFTAWATWQTFVHMAGRPRATGKRSSQSCTQDREGGLGGGGRALAVTVDAPGSSGDWTHTLPAGQVVASSLLLLSAHPEYVRQL